MPPIKDPFRFIRSETRIKPVPHAEEISLHLADEAMDLWQKTEDELGEMGLPPPFWAFAWAGGQGLARYILDEPETVRGKAILDFACGSGLVGIAAMKAGAAECLAVDVDPFAMAATELNTELNKVVVKPLLGDITDDEPLAADIVFCGDVFYDKPLAERVLRLMDRYLARDVPVLVGDPGRSYLPRTRLTELAVYEVPVVGALEDAEIKKTRVYRLTT